MFAALEEKLIVIGLAVITAVAVLGWTEHLGYQRCTKQDVVAVSKQETKNAATVARDTEIVHEEASTYAAAAAAPVLAPVHIQLRVCNPPDRLAMPDPSAARPGADGAAAIPAADHGEALRGPARDGPDIGPGLQAVGEDADARVRGLQDYITRVCRAAAP